VLAVALILLISVIMLLILGRFLLQRRTRHRVASVAGIHGPSTSEKVSIGGIDQWISIEASDTSKPVLLFLRGGPGLPIPFGVGFRGRHRGLVAEFVVPRTSRPGG
jgi:hypothetical protein